MNHQIIFLISRLLLSSLPSLTTSAFILRPDEAGTQNEVDRGPERILKTAQSDFCFSPNGAEVATWSRSHHHAFFFSSTTDSDFKLWDVESGEQRISITGTFSALDFAPNGTTLAIQEGDRVSIWDVKTGSRLASLDHPNVSEIKFLRSGQLLATTCFEELPLPDGPPTSIKFWDTETWKEAKTGIDPHFQFYGVPAITSDGQWLAVFVRGSNGVVSMKILSIDSGTEQPAPKIPGSFPLGSSIFVGPGPETLTIDVRTEPKTIFWDLNAKEARISRDYLYPEPSSYTWVNLSGASTITNAVELKESKFVVREWRTDSVIRELQNPTNWQKPSTYRNEFPFHTGSYLAGSELLMLSSAPEPEGEINIWNLDTRELEGTLRTEFTIGEIRISNDGRMLAVRSLRDPSSMEQTICRVSIWDLATRKEISTLDSDSFIGSIDISPDGTLLAIADVDEVHVREVATGKLVNLFNSERLTGNSVAFSPDGQCLAIGTDSDTQLWDVAHARRKWKSTELRSIDRLAFHPDGKTIAACARLSEGRSSVSVINASDGAIIFNSMFKSVSFIQFASDGKKLNLVRSDGQFSRLDVASEKATIVARLGGPNVPTDSRTCRFALHDATNTLVAARLRVTYSGSEGEIALCDARTGEQKSMLSAPTGDITCVQVTPDGRTVIGGGAARKTLNLEIVDLKSGELTGSFCHIQVEAVSPDGELLVTRDKTTGGLVICKTRGGTKLTRLTDKSGAQFSLDGTMFGTIGDGNVKLWSVANLLQNE